MKKLDDLLRRRPEGCISELAAELYLCGETTGARREEIEAHIKTCASCEELITAMQKASEGLKLRQSPVPAEPERVSFFESLARLLLRPAVLVPVSVLAVFLAAIPLYLQHTDETENASVREKGGASLHFFVRTESGSRPGIPGETLKAGDTIRFSANAGDSGYVMIVNVEETGKVTRYYPAGPQSAPVEASREVVLPGSIVLDDYVGMERIFALFSDMPLSFDEVAAAAAEGLKARGLREMETLPLGCPQASVLIEKVK